MLTKIRTLPARSAYPDLAARIPQDIRDRLTRADCDRLAAVFAPAGGNHGIALKASFNWITGRYFLAFLAGRERRSEQRLRAEGHVIVPVGISVFIFLALLICYGIVPLAFVLYLVKSALRINIMDGPSPLHAWMCG